MNNQVTMSGIVTSNLSLDHEYYSERFYLFYLSVKRTSGTVDTIPVIVSDRLLDITKDIKGEYVSIVGEFRSFNLHSDGKTKLLLYIFPTEIKILSSPSYVNNAIIQGSICKNPIYRETPYGRMITDIILAVNRGYNKSDYLPAIAWGRNAYFLSTLHTGSSIRVAGRVQSRDYTKDGIKKTAYELSINLLETVS